MLFNSIAGLDIQFKYCAMGHRLMLESALKLKKYSYSLFQKGYYMSAHVLLNLLNSL